MGNRAKRARRCEKCRLHLSACLCAEIPNFDLNTKLVLVMHQREVHKTTATAPWALLALKQSELHVHGERESTLNLSSLQTPERRILLLFPSEQARPLTPQVLSEDARPVTLIVPDGTWRQAKRAAKRIRNLIQAEPVCLSGGPASEYKLRREPQVEGLATFEAIARAMGIIEGRGVQVALEAAFARLVHATLASRGVVAPLAKNNASTIAADVTAPPQVSLEILYQDDDLIAINKPSGMPVHRGWAKDGLPALQALRNQIGRHVYPVHRLDRATSGVLLFALSSEAARDIQRIFDERRAKKTYLALCRGHSASLTHVDHPLAKVKGGTARPAVTDFRLLGQFERYGLYAAQPHTGRLHQIRRHLKHKSHPIIGDVRYGKGEHNRIFRERFGFHRLALHAALLELEHPRTQEALVLRAPLPEDLKLLFAQLNLPMEAGI
ncbi:MAG: DTW domain-containing protein [Polyangiaceae bacterium]|nr:DTW domain-containing protein [Polyangiaceae bacterium]